MLSETGGTIVSGDSKTFIQSALAARYELLDEIGRGGIAVVYKARQKNLDRIIALKILPQQFTHDKEFLERFHREAREAAKLNHPNILTIHDEGIENNVHFIAMEYLEGENLHAIIKQKGKLNSTETVHYISPIAEALSYAHDKGVIHRDVKSSNIFIISSGRPVLMDFGIAYAAAGTKLTRTGTVLGTPEYMSLEQADGKPTDARSDIYSLGIVLYECMTGETPHRGDNPLTIIHKILYDSIEIPASYRVPLNIAGVIKKCVEKSPAERFQNAKEISAALSGKKYTPAQQKKEPRKKINTLQLTLGTLVILLLAVLTYLLTKREPEQQSIIQTSPITTASQNKAIPQSISTLPKATEVIPQANEINELKKKTEALEKQLKDQEEKAKKEEETKKRAAQTPAITQPAQQPATQPIVNIPPSQPAQQSAKAAESTSAPMPFVAIENPPEIIHHEPAKYPDIAIKMGIQGRVTVEVTVDAQGKPIQTKVVKSPSDVFNDAAVEAVMKYTFKPAMTITGPVTAKVYIPIDFRLR
jgi:TonB family protein